MTCNNCEKVNPANATFCSSCGERLVVLKERKLDYKKPLNRVFFIFFGILLYIVILNLIDTESTYQNSLIIDSILALIVVSMMLPRWKKTRKLLLPSKVKLSVLSSVIIGAILFAFAITYLIDYLYSLSTYIESSTSLIYSDSPAPLLIAIITVGVFPAIFEEIAFRGIIFDDVFETVRLKSTIIITAIFFTIIHLSLLSFIWILPLGLVFGYLRSRYRTIFYGIIGHFVYNSTIVLIEYFQYHYAH